MINVTIGESKTQELKPFPKLMKHNDGTITYFSSMNNGVHIYARASMKEIIGVISHSISMDEYSDFKEPITLQNA